MDIDIKFRQPNDPIHISHRKRDTKYAMPEYHSHVDHYEVYYLMTGRRKYFIEDRAYYVNPGNLVFIRKGVLHRTFQVNDHTHERLLINFTERYLEDTSESHSALLQAIFDKTLIIQLSGHEKHEFEQILFTIIREIKEKGEGFELYLRALSYQLLVTSKRYLNRNRARMQEFKGSVHHKMTDIIHYINKHYRYSELSLASVAREFYISPYYLSRIFKVATGFTYSEYLNHVRIQEAQRLLRESDIKIIDIAGKVGFNSLTHFGRVFKRNTRYAPTFYRKMHHYSRQS